MSQTMIPTRQVKLRYGQGHLALRLPESADVLSGADIPPLPDADRAVRHALANPIGLPPFRQVLAAKGPGRPGFYAAITISDITRPVPNKVIVSALLDELNAGGVKDAQVVIIIATGMHRPSTPKEREIMLGSEILRRVEVIDHKADDAASLVRVSETPPVSVNARFAKASLKIVTGLIEPHFMAGYSGGRKGVCPGLVDLATVQRFHGFQVLSDPRSDNGVLDGNPCHQESLRVAKIVGVDFLVNVSITHDRRPAGVYAGDMVEAHLAGVKQVAGWTSAEVREPYDLVVTCAGGFPLDQSFYQTVKGVCGAQPAMHAGSTLLIASACHEVGSPECVATLRRWGKDWRGFLDHIKATPVVIKDQWQLQMHARVLALIGVERLLLVADRLSPTDQSWLAITPGPGMGVADAGARMQRCIDEYVAAHPDARVAVIPEGPYTMLTRA